MSGLRDQIMELDINNSNDGILVEILLEIESRLEKLESTVCRYKMERPSGMTGPG
jgi:hypothetical protein